MHITSIESICFTRLLLLFLAAKQTVNRSSAAYLHRLHAGRPVSRPVNVGWLPRMGKADVEVVIVVRPHTTTITYDGPRPGPARKNAWVISWAGGTLLSHIL